MAKANNDDPRKHHYVPASVLAGFTRGGGKTDALHTVDLKRRHYRKSKPINEGFQRDFYRVDHEPDPFLIERTFANEIEPRFKAALREIERTDTIPTDDEHQDALMSLVYVLCTRVPQRREEMNGLYDQTAKMLLRMHASHFAAFQSAMRAIGEDDSAEAFREFQESLPDLESKVRWSMDTTAAVIGELQQDKVFQALCARSWMLLVAPQPDVEFICSDSPVTTVGPAAGLAMRDNLVCVPLTRRHALIGGWGESPGAKQASIEQVAFTNTERIRNADIVWAPDPDFVFLAPGNKVERGHRELLAAIEREAGPAKAASR